MPLAGSRGDTRPNSTVRVYTTGYLEGKDERVSQYFAELWTAVKSGYMRAVNVFSEGDDKFADVSVAAGPVIVFTDGINSLS